MKKNTKETAVVKNIPAPKKKKASPKFKLVSYTMKAIIPTGMYSNLQPEITVEAESIEHAERAVMPHIEALFAKYREGSVPTVTKGLATNSIIESLKVPETPKNINPAKNTKIVNPNESLAVDPNRSTATASPEMEKKVENMIVMSQPFNRAKSAVNSCVSADALKLVDDQISKSSKLIDSEKAELRKIVDAKKKELSK